MILICHQRDTFTEYSSHFCLNVDVLINPMARIFKKDFHASLCYNRQMDIHDSFILCKKMTCINTMTSWWAQWRLKSPASRLFTQPFIQGADQRKYESSASLAGDRWIPRAKGPLRGNVSIWWRHHIYAPILLLLAIICLSGLGCSILCESDHVRNAIMNSVGGISHRSQNDG